MTEILDHLRYSRDHLWVSPVGETGRVRVGVTDFAQDSLGDVVDVTLPEPGEIVRTGIGCGDIESTKSVNDLVAPISGTIHARNDALAGDPGLLNTDPYQGGWLFEADVDPATLEDQLTGLMDADSYRDLVGAG